MTTEKDVKIHVKGLKKSFGHVHVLKGIDAEIKAGEVICVIGPSGSGKSTFLRCLNRLEDPTDGRIIFAGEDLMDSKTDIDMHRQKMGMVFQHFNLFPNMTVLKNITLAPVRLGKWKKEEADEKAIGLLKRIGLEKKALSYPSKLSGGQKQRVAVAGIIAMKPMCIVLDEPTAMLDPSGRKEVLSTIKKLNKEDGITIVLITHYMDEAVQADRVVVMDGGEIKLDDTPQNVFSKFDEVKSLGLDVPQSTELIHRLGLKSENTILNADDCVKFLKKTLEAKV